jgi:hypothetical protein
MSHQRRRRTIHFRILLGDVLVVALLVAALVAAWIHWPQKAIADIAIPLAALVAFAEWRLSRPG